MTFMLAVSNLHQTQQIIKADYCYESFESLCKCQDLYSFMQSEHNSNLAKMMLQQLPLDLSDPNAHHILFS